MKSFVLLESPNRTTRSSSTSSLAALLLMIYFHLQQSSPVTISGKRLLLQQPRHNHYRVPSGFISSIRFIPPRALRSRLRHNEKATSFQHLFRTHEVPQPLRQFLKKATNRYNYRSFTTSAVVQEQEIEGRQPLEPWRRFIENPTNCTATTNGSLRIHDTMSTNTVPVTNATLDARQQQVLWTVCQKCHGEGRMYSRSRKARRLKLEIQDDGTRSDSNNRNTRNPNDQSNVSITICKCCEGSGLIPLEQQSISAVTNFGEHTDHPNLRRPIRIAVIGGGIGGLAFAAACQHRNMQVTVYERDTHFTQRKQGYGLTLQQASKQLMGLGILPENLTSSAMSSGITSTKHIVHDENGNVKGTWGLRHWLKDETGSTSNNNRSNAKSDGALLTSQHPNNRKHQSTTIKCDNNKDTPDDNICQTQQSTKQIQSRRRQNIHIARQALRYELYLAATANEHRRSNGPSNTDHKNSIIQWNHRLLKYNEREDGVELTFAVSDDNECDSEVRTVTSFADIVVGADGIRSQVRQQFFGSEDGTQLRYLDCIVILGICPLSELDKLVIQSSSFGHLLDGQTVFQTADGVTRIYMMPYSQTEYMWQLSFPLSESDAKNLSALGSVALRDAALSRCRTWHTPIPDILKCTPIDLISGYPVYDRDLVQPHQLHRHEHPYSRRITFIGDAIHCMSPFKGQGANQALLDALSLARYLFKAIRMTEKLPHGAMESNHHNDTVMTSKKQKFEVCDAERTCELNGTEIEKILEQYEKEMLSRSAVKVKASADAAHFLHTNIAIQEGDITRGTAAAISETKSTL